MYKPLKSIRMSLKKALDFSEGESLDSGEIKRSIQSCYKTLGVSEQPFLMNYGIKDKSAQQLMQSLKLSPTSPGNDLLSEQLVCFLLKDLPTFNDKKSLLDIGCGNGSASKLIRKLVNLKKYTGIDLSYDQIKRAKEFFSDEPLISFMQADAELLPFKNASFDIITSLESSHLYPSPATFFQQAFDLLAPGGYFCFVDIILDSKKQDKALIEMVKNNNQLKIIKKKNITRPVRKAIKERMITNEKSFLAGYHSLHQDNHELAMAEFPYYAISLGSWFIPNRYFKKSTPVIRESILQAVLDPRFVPINPKRASYQYYLVRKEGAS